MVKKKLKTAAPMPKEEKTIQNPMKFYTYLVCISGLATYPENTRMFRQKDLMLSKIKEATGITDKTAKLYLQILEREGLVQYRGEIKHLLLEEEQEIKEKIQNLPEGQRDRKLKELTGAALWKRRNKEEKDGVYYIPRPHIWTPVPEDTLKTLNEDFECSELELKLYLLCCNYRDLCVLENRPFKVITFELIRNSLDLKNTSGFKNRDIRRALMFLKTIGLINYIEGAGVNRKLAKIPSFKIQEVNYYINYKTELFNSDDIENDEDLRAVVERVGEITNKE